MPSDSKEGQGRLEGVGRPARRLAERVALQPLTQELERHGDHHGARKKHCSRADEQSHDEAERAHELKAGTRPDRPGWRRRRPGRWPGGGGARRRMMASRSSWLAFIARAQCEGTSAIGGVPRRRRGHGLVRGAGHL